HRSATTAIYLLSLHDALPICDAVALFRRDPDVTSQRDRNEEEAKTDSLRHAQPCGRAEIDGQVEPLSRVNHRQGEGQPAEADDRSEEHTSELQSHLNLVCRRL